MYSNAHTLSRVRFQRQHPTKKLPTVTSIRAE